MAITQQQAQERAEAVAREYEQLSYEELLARHESNCKDPDALSVFEDLPGGEIFIDVDIGTLGFLRKRVSVEIVVAGDGWENWKQPGCVWLERYASGKLLRCGGGEMWPRRV